MMYFTETEALRELEILMQEHDFLPADEKVLRRT